ncbi:unnamed protein product [Durusdinium trenchii]|uniref:RRM domain-containing protein n=1 Tax=Durusdinium trenchii TaxID=1381693 RepID=A0ABP0NEI4_9DINO
MAGRLFGSAVQSVQGRPARGKGKGNLGTRAVIPKIVKGASADVTVRGRGTHMYGGGGMGGRSPALTAGNYESFGGEYSAGSNPRASAFARAFDVEEQAAGPVRKVRGRRVGPYDEFEVDADYNGFPRYSQYDWDEPDWEHDQFDGPQTVGSAIFVRNLPPGVEGQQLKHLFEEAGQIANIQVDQGPLPTATIGYVRQGVGFDAAELFHGRYLLGHELKVTVKAAESTAARKSDDDFWRQELRDMKQRGSLRNDPWLLGQFGEEDMDWVGPRKGKGGTKGRLKGSRRGKGGFGPSAGMHSALAWDD